MNRITYIPSVFFRDHSSNEILVKNNEKLFS